MSKGQEQTSLDRWEVQLRKGCLDLAVLACLWGGAAYGLEILRRLGEGGGLAVPEGTIYPLLSRLRAEGMVTSHWVEAEAGHPRKYYELTALGRARVRAMGEAWARLALRLDALLIPLREEAIR